ncbi:MAG: hypothetical protein IJW86_03420 [Clostridia bacterium]|nr:hypothetical protein [Clostridia bacterium]
MEMEVSEKDRIVYYWLTNEEKEDAEFRQSLKPQYGEWSRKGYKVCVFLSGKGNLVELTKELLVHNKHVIAKRNVRQAMERER